MVRTRSDLITVLVCYDVETVTSAGRKRLRLVARLCKGRGQRVQKSVFECRGTRDAIATLKLRLARVIDHESDSVRLYGLVGEQSEFVETLGVDRSYDPDGLLLFDGERQRS